MDTKLFHSETPITAQSFDIRADYAARYGTDPNTQKQTYQLEYPVSRVR